MPQWDRPVEDTTGTRGHRALHDAIVAVGFDVEDEHAVGRYSIDCYVREAHLGFEFDGPKHGWRSAKKRDSERDLWIRENGGIPIMRVTDRDVSRRSELAGRIRQFIIDNEHDIADRRAQGWALV
jgi:very-short-patch-repair endonuclease